MQFSPPKGGSGTANPNDQALYLLTGKVDFKVITFPASTEYDALTDAGTEYQNALNAGYVVIPEYCIGGLAGGYCLVLAKKKDK